MLNSEVLEAREEVQRGQYVSNPTTTRSVEATVEDDQSKTRKFSTIANWKAEEEECKQISCHRRVCRVFQEEEEVP